MGSPMVFHTAPPQPASNARMICSPQLVGGAEASQNGLGDRMPPAKVVARSGIHYLAGDGRAGTLSIRYCIHHLAPSVRAIAARIIFRMAGAATGAIHLHAAGSHLNTAALLQQRYQRRLPYSGDHHVAEQV